MDLPILITGGNSPKRKEKAAASANEYSASFDIHPLDAVENFGIGDIRNLSAKFKLRPFRSAFQTFIINEAQNLTIEAQNSLLKNLEEVPATNKIILTAPTRESLLSTIVSRCQEWPLPVEIEKSNDKFLAKFLEIDPYQRYKQLDRFNLDDWLRVWRKIILDFIGTEKGQFSTSAPTSKVLSYLKFLLRLRSTRRKNASPKLVKIIALINAPKLAQNEQKK